MSPKADGTEMLTIHNVQLEINSADKGGEHYKGRQHVEEARSPFWDLLHQCLGPQVVIDIGANYGFTASVFATALRPARLVAIEPDPNLTGYLQRNLARNAAPEIDIHVLPCLVGEEDKTESSFGLNPAGSQDNRVLPVGNWPTCIVEVRTMGSLLTQFAEGRPVFIKVDTQGYDPVVIRSGLAYLQKHDNWLIRSEFAPHWMHSQKQDPVAFLAEMTRIFRVFEAPARVPFFSSIESVFETPLPESEIELERFVSYVESLNHNRRGWLDIFVMPRAPAWFVKGD